MTKTATPREISFRNAMAAERHGLADGEFETLMLLGENTTLEDGRRVVSLNEALAGRLFRCGHERCKKLYLRLRGLHIVFSSAGEFESVIFAANDQQPAARVKPLFPWLIRGEDDSDPGCEGQSGDDERKSDA